MRLVRCVKALEQASFLFGPRAIGGLLRIYPFALAVCPLREMPENGWAGQAACRFFGYYMNVYAETRNR